MRRLRDGARHGIVGYDAKSYDPDECGAGAFGLRYDETAAGGRSRACGGADGASGDWRRGPGCGAGSDHRGRARGGGCGKACWRRAGFGNCGGGFGQPGRAGSVGEICAGGGQGQGPGGDGKWRVGGGGFVAGDGGCLVVAGGVPGFGVGVDRFARGHDLRRVRRSQGHSAPRPVGLTPEDI